MSSKANRQKAKKVNQKMSTTILW